MLYPNHLFYVLDLTPKYIHYLLHGHYRQLPHPRLPISSVNAASFLIPNSLFTPFAFSFADHNNSFVCVLYYMKPQRKSAIIEII